MSKLVLTAKKNIQNSKKTKKEVIKAAYCLMPSIYVISGLFMKSQVAELSSIFPRISTLVKVGHLDIASYSPTKVEILRKHNTSTGFYLVALPPNTSRFS